MLGAKGALTLNGEYVAGSLSHLPAAHLTPYSEIHSAPPASYVLLKHTRRETWEYWRFDSSNRFVTARIPRTKSTSGTASAKRCAAAFVRTLRFSQNSAAEWILLRSFVLQTV